MPLSIELVTSPRGLAALAPEWEALALRSETDEPMASPTWVRAWWSVFGGWRRGLRVVLVRDARRVVAIAPFLVRWTAHRGVLPFRRLELLCSGEDEADEIVSEYLGVIVERGAEEAAAQAIAAWIPRPIDEIVLPLMDGERTMPGAIALALRARGFRVDLAEVSRAPFIRLPQTFDAYLAALSSSHRYTIRRSLRDFDAWSDGSSELTVARDRQAVEASLATLERLHGERWASRGGERAGGAFTSEKFRRFHHVVIPELMAKNALELACLTVRGEPVAAAYNLVWKGKVYFYQGGRSLDVPEKLRLGLVLHARTIAHAIAEGRREYDFLGGASRYKMDLATETRPLVTLRAVRPSARDLVRRLAEHTVEAVRAHRAK